MKKQLTILFILIISMAFAQKAELKTVKKAIAKNNFSEALATLATVKGMPLDDKSKAKYLFYTINALKGSGQLSKAANTISELIDFEKKTGKQKFTKQVTPILDDIYLNLATKGFKEYNSKNYKLAKTTFEQAYNLKKSDTLSLYNAANAAYLDKDYDTAIKHFKTLKDLNYTGIETLYQAHNNASGKMTRFNSKKDMDKSVKMKISKDPKVTVLKSKKIAIIKNIAFAYIAKGDNTKAIEAIQDAKKADPTNADIIINEANIELKMGNKDRFKQLMKDAILLRPNDATLHYNIGVINQVAGNIQEAKVAYNKAIALNPDFGDAYLNLGLAMLLKDQTLVDEMNANANDFDKYDEIKVRQLALYKEVLPIFEKANSLKDNDKDIMRTLMNLYENLEMTEKLKATKAIFDTL